MCVCITVALTRQLTQTATVTNVFETKHFTKILKTFKCLVVKNDSKPSSSVKFTHAIVILYISFIVLLFIQALFFDTATHCYELPH